MKSLILFAVLITGGLQWSWAQDTNFNLRAATGQGTSPAGTSRIVHNRPGERSLAPDTTLALRMRTVRLKAVADTSKFVPNRQGEWSLFNSYLAAAGQDSILLEAAVAHSRDADWSQYQPFGRIRDKKLWPSNAVEVRYYLLTDGYTIRVEPDGRCSIKLVEGQLPPNDPVVLPIRITFKGK